MLNPPLPDRGCAVFFDFDGTLAHLAEQPQAVQVPHPLIGQLARLSDWLGGAVAIVSGRPIADLDRHLDPLRLPVAGVHGAERRSADGHTRRVPVPDLREAARLIESLCTRDPRLLMETKPGAIALHYRQADELEDRCLATMAEAVLQVEGMALLRGKKVVELKPRRATKGAAVRAFLDERPFRLRRPWYFGDDVTDEGAFEIVQTLGGTAVKIGDGETLAAHRLPSPEALWAWIEQAIDSPAPATWASGR